MTGEKVRLGMSKVCCEVVTSVVLRYCKGRSVVRALVRALRCDVGGRNGTK